MRKIDDKIFLTKIDAQKCRENGAIVSLAHLSIIVQLQKKLVNDRCIRCTFDTLWLENEVN